MIVFTNGERDTVIRAVDNLSREDEVAACEFLQFVVNNWCEALPEIQFAVHDLVGKGGLYYNMHELAYDDWKSTPLRVIRDNFDRDVANGSTIDAFEEAGHAVGWLLKKVLHEDARTFMVEERATEEHPDVNHYTLQPVSASSAK